MRTLLVPALFVSLSVPALAHASSPASDYDDVSYPRPHATTTIPQRELVATSLDDAGVARPDGTAPGARVRVVLAAANPHDDAGLRGPELAPGRAAPAAKRVVTARAPVAGPIAMQHQMNSGKNYADAWAAGAAADSADSLARAARHESAMNSGKNYADARPMPASDHAVMTNALRHEHAMNMGLDHEDARAMAASQQR